MEEFLTLKGMIINLKNITYIRRKENNENVLQIRLGHGEMLECKFNTEKELLEAIDDIIRDLN